MTPLAAAAQFGYLTALDAGGPWLLKEWRLRCGQQRRPFIAITGSRRVPVLSLDVSPLGDMQITREGIRAAVESVTRLVADAAVTLHMVLQADDRADDFNPLTIEPLPMRLTLYGAPSQYAAAIAADWAVVFTRPEMYTAET